MVVEKAVEREDGVGMERGIKMTCDWKLKIHVLDRTDRKCSFLIPLDISFVYYLSIL